MGKRCLVATSLTGLLILLAVLAAVLLGGFALSVMAQVL